MIMLLQPSRWSEKAKLLSPFGLQLAEQAWGTWAGDTNWGNVNWRWMAMGEFSP